jgi:hypothetical protein
MPVIPSSLERRPKQEASWECLTHLARSQELVKKYLYQQYDGEVPFRFPVNARKSARNFVAQCPVMI